MEIFMKESGKMIKHLDMEPIFIQMEPDIKANGRMTISMEREFRLGSMEANMMDFTLRARRVGKESIHGEMEVIILVHGKITK